jgi:hypothetical protein
MYHTTSSKKDPKTVPSAGKIMGTVLWDSEGRTVVIFLFGKEEKRSMQLGTFRRSTNFVVRFVKKVRRRKLSSSFNMIKQGITPHV